ncbi:MULTISPECIES: TIGR03894 family protein [Prochlorococcus]|uniref:TIGR03894 family protein n=1 Tax=Prochlorococcus TaxID=1218 RepID=UPI000533B00A|nr:MULTISPECIES: TIGR03894 family protein [Prochlorococcus]KGG12688.1 hypothetical protein EV05_1905 [Prochlorococcus sp. MIT 0601]
MTTDKALLKEVTKELWHTVKKLRPELDRDPRLQLVLKALITIGDLPNQVEAAMIVGVCAEMEEKDSTENKDANKTKTSEEKESPEGRRLVRRSSASK